MKNQQVNDRLNNINQRSEFAHEIISENSDFFEKWALLICLLILLLLFFGCWFIQYPDIIETQATLTANNAPKEIIVQNDGRLVKLFVENNQNVSKGQVVGWIESTANHAEILKLSQKVNQGIAELNVNNFNQIYSMYATVYNNLGDLQEFYEQFMADRIKFGDYMKKGYYSQNKGFLETDIRSLQQIGQTIKNQLVLKKQDLKIAMETFNMNKKLFDEKVITIQEYRVERSKLLAKQNEIPQLNASLLTNQNQVNEKLKQIKEVDHNSTQQNFNFSQALLLFKSQIDSWMKKYVLISPINGKMYFVIPLQEDQYLQRGKLIGYVNPSGSKFYAEAYMSQTNFGKVHLGLPVQLRFDAYPFQEVGFVEGEINYISNVPSDNGFLVTIKLSKGLITNNHKNIPYRNGLKADALIITKRSRLAERFYYNIIKSISVGGN